MRKNIARIIAAFEEKRAKTDGDIYTDGHAIWSYGVRIVWRDESGDIQVADADSTRTQNSRIRACQETLVYWCTKHDDCKSNRELAFRCHLTTYHKVRK